MKGTSSSDSILNNSKDKKSTLQTKIVIRRLPPSWTKEEFVEHLSPLPEHDYLLFVRADYSLGKEAYSRGYLNFVNPDDIYNFREKFDDYIFLDSKGGEYAAVVEFAPFQKVPRKKPKKVDAKNATIDQDADYKKFLDQLENPVVEPGPTMDDTIEELEAKERHNKENKHAKTPLIEYIKRKREERRQFVQRSREERRRKDAERFKRDDKRKKEVDNRPQVKEREKTPDKEDSKSKPVEKEKLRFSKENREKMSKERATSSESKDSKDRSNQRDPSVLDAEKSKSDTRLGSSRGRDDKVKDSRDEKPKPLRDAKVDDKNSHRHDRNDRKVKQDTKNIEKDKTHRDQLDIVQKTEKPAQVDESQEVLSLSQRSSQSIEEDTRSSQESHKSDSVPDTSDNNRRRRRDRPEKALYVPRRAREANNKQTND